MRLLGNILWFILGGFVTAVSWFATGILWCLTIIGIPVGIQCFKFAALSLWPFGKEIMYHPSTISFCRNISLFFTFGFGAIVNVIKDISCISFAVR